MLDAEASHHGDPNTVVVSGRFGRVPGRPQMFLGQFVEGEADTPSPVRSKSCNINMRFLDFKSFLILQFFHARTIFNEENLNKSFIFTRLAINKAAIMIKCIFITKSNTCCIEV